MQGPQQVTVNLYDLSQGLAKNMSRMIIGKQVDGIWHTGIVVYGQEYYYGGGICSGTPAGTPYGRPVQTIPIGTTEIPQEVFLEYLNEIAPRFAPEKYDLFKNNCNNFSDEIAQFLTGSGIPRHIIDLPNEVLKTPMGKQLMQMMGGSGNNIMDPRTMEGAHNPQQMHLNYGPGAHNLPTFDNSGNASQPKPAGGQPVSELLSQADYTREIQANTAVVIDVFTEWCGPCQAIKPFFAGLPQQYPQVRFFKMDLDKNRFLSSNLGIQSIPTFLFIHKGQVVKKMAGADKNGLVTNIKWLISTYNLVSAGGAQQAPAPAPVKKTIQVYKETNSPYFFEGEKWELPMKKLKEFGTKNSLFSQEPYKSLESHLVTNFNAVSEDGKKEVVSYALKNMPVDDIENVVPFIDFVKICLMKEDLAKIVCSDPNFERNLNTIFSKYILNNKFPADVSPKVVRTIVWRALTNLAKTSEGKKLALNLQSEILLSAIETLKNCKSEAGVILACVMAINNLVFFEGFNSAEVPKEDLFKAISENFASENEDTLIALLNILCRLAATSKDFKEYLKKTVFTELKTRVDTLKYHKNTTVQAFVEDLYLILE